MTKKEDTVPKPKPKIKTNHTNRTHVKKIRGYDALKPLLREDNNIVSGKCGKHESVNGLLWYTKLTK